MEDVMGSTAPVDTEPPDAAAAGLRTFTTVPKLLTIHNKEINQKTNICAYINI